ncbi:hypothetical protein GCM10010371_37560 [Streptomyces subrutilus]|uniref:Uncharacterized protein n=1 Tax=Streptomyces subrutilus TaxID=36818 RepID=A0A918V6P1_9ACTN|nr:hypothetical protein GCM10010371_37560 [Streptomyces subrutilus]
MSSSVTPASRAAWTVARDSARSLSPYRADIPMQPRPSGKTAGPVVPSRRRGAGSEEGEGGEGFGFVVMRREWHDE